MSNQKKRNTIPRHKLTFGQKAADSLSKFAGSWTFIISIVSFMILWIAVNVYFIFFRWDPYPFILFNLVLSCLAALQAPVILMAQNRQEERDRIRAEYDYKVNRKAEREIQNVQKDLDEIKKMLKKRH